MDIFKIENLFANSSFLFLFVSMICYWIQVAFVQKKYNFGKLSMICANVCLFTLLGIRWKESGHFPLSNLYESLMFLSWSLSTFHLVLENEDIPRKNFQKNSQFFLGALTSPMALFINAFATFRLPEEMQHSSALVPALQSNWLMMHVTVMILSYSALICGSLLSIAFLIVTRKINMDNNFQKTNSEFLGNGSKGFPTNTFVLPSPTLSDSQTLIENSFSSSAVVEPLVGDVHQNKKPNMDFSFGFFTNQKTSFESFDSLSLTKKKFLEDLDNLSYRILGIGFPFLTIGILSGAVWANEAWGSYWSWDPKETWALATWLVFAIYLHTRFTKGWSGKKPAFLASFGFVIVWICFLGVNLLGEGLHSYGFFSK